jgi:putative DNA primase/helicase
MAGPLNDAPPMWLAAPFEVLGHTRDHAGEAWGLWLRWRDRDGTTHSYALPAELTLVEPGRLEAGMARRGLRLNANGTARAYLRAALARVATAVAEATEGS